MNLVLFTPYTMELRNCFTRFGSGVEMGIRRIEKIKFIYEMFEGMYLPYGTIHTLERVMDLGRKNVSFLSLLSSLLSSLNWDECGA